MIWIRWSAGPFIQGWYENVFAITPNHTSSWSGTTNHLFLGVQVNCLRWYGKLLELKGVIRKGKIGEEEEGGASEVRSAGTTLSSSPGSARSRRHKQSLEPSVAHTYWRAWHTKKKLWSVQCLTCQVHHDYFTVSAAVLKLQKLWGNNAFYLNMTGTNPNSLLA